MCFLLIKSNLYVNFNQIRTKNKKVGLANFCAYGHLKIISFGTIRIKKMQLVLYVSISIPFLRHRALKIRNCERGYAFVGSYLKIFLRSKK